MFLNGSLTSSYNNSSLIFNSIEPIFKDSFNLSIGGFNPPSPPGGPGGAYSPLFNQPILDFNPLMTLDLDFLRRIEVLQSPFDAIRSLFSKYIAAVDSISTSSSGISYTTEALSKTFLPVTDTTNTPEYLVYGAMFSSPERTQEINALAQAENIDALGELSDKELKKIDVIELAKTGKVEALKYLRSRGVDLTKQSSNYHRNNVIHTAAESGQVEVLKYFHSLGFGLNQNPNSSGNFPSHLAILKGRLNVLKYFDEIGIDYNFPSQITLGLFSSPQAYRSPLELAIISGNVEVAEHIRQRGYDVNELGPIGRAPVHIAVVQTWTVGSDSGKGSGSAQASASLTLSIPKMLGMLRWLQQQGADLNLKDKKTQTIAHYLANALSTGERGHQWDALYEDTKQQLKALGVNFDVRDKDGMLPDDIFGAMSDVARDVLLNPPRPEPDYD